MDTIVENPCNGFTRKRVYEIRHKIERKKERERERESLNEKKHEGEGNKRVYVQHTRGSKREKAV